MDLSRIYNYVMSCNTEKSRPLIAMLNASVPPRDVAVLVYQGSPSLILRCICKFEMIHVSEISGKICTMLDKFS